MAQGASVAESRQVDFRESGNRDKGRRGGMSFAMAWRLNCPWETTGSIEDYERITSGYWKIDAS